ncbi:hypothetical protein H5V45_12680 [Nocardioides sp. KIGAM211]|uniref:Uncharacterized protein n=1 Tax=Nocardioides luti TaxID=2761101 RepID=A0A7X0RH46_9ACTN|nr:hypothetical protein [Nocardioides luti]MBB6628177.1 hypothetical protein [Nocardioides luti]
MTTRPLRILAPALLGLAALAAPALAVGGPADAAPATLEAAAPTAPHRADSVNVRPATLDRGAGPKVPQVLGTTILDRGTKITTRAQEVQLYGVSDGAYVIGVWGRNGSSRVERVTKDGERTTILQGIRGDILLSTDGRQLFEGVVPRVGTTRVTVLDAVTGERVARRTFDGYVRVLDADEDRAVLGGTGPARTFWWNNQSDLTSRISKREGYVADIRADRVGTFSRTAEGSVGSSFVTSLAKPRTTLWRSSQQAVLAIAPSGRRLLTTYLNTDGPIGQLEVHGATGRKLVTYRTPGFFDAAAWETNQALLLTVQERDGSGVTLVRAQGTDLERASARMAP